METELKATANQRVRKVGTSYVVTVTKMCRKIGVTQNDIVKVTVERADDTENNN